MLQLPYQFGRSGMDRLNIPLGSLVFTLLCGIHSRLALGITSSSGWNSSQNPTTSPTSFPQPFLVPLLKLNGFMFFHRLVIPLRSYLFSNCGLNEFTRLNGQFSSGPSIRLFSKNVKPGIYLEFFIRKNSIYVQSLVVVEPTKMWYPEIEEIKSLPGTHETKI
ncbi:Putative cytochrome c biogenesis ccmB-like mitochondrial protein [Arachis hypogaea]|nr:Putative cytochrome c biogenesis ccmB-like mitochondrial protein [Arachis hypogaea]